MKHLNSVWLEDDIVTKLGQYLEKQSKAGNPVSYDSIINEALRLWLKAVKGMVDLSEGDFIIVYERNGSTHIRGRISKKELASTEDYQHVDLILDTGEKIRKVLYVKGFHN